MEIERTLADFVVAISGEDINGMDSSEYRRLRSSVLAITTREEQATFYATGEIPTRFETENER